MSAAIFLCLLAAGYYIFKMWPMWCKKKSLASQDTATGADEGLELEVVHKVGVRVVTVSGVAAA